MRMGRAGGLLVDGTACILARCIFLAFLVYALRDSVQGWKQIGLYKIFVHFEAVVHDSIILFLPPPTRIAHTIAILLARLLRSKRLLPEPSLVSHTPYNIGYDYRVKAKKQTI